MSNMMSYQRFFQLFDASILKLEVASGLGPLLLRLYLAPVFMQAGYNKFIYFDSTVQWFGNAEWGLGLIFPELMVYLAGGAELIGGFLLLPGLAIRLVVVPLMVTMVVAIFAVHWENGWLAISDASSWLANDRVIAAVNQKQRVIEILKEHGHYGYLTQNGSITLLNNGIEFAVTYFIMLFSLFFTGAGRFTSIDYFIYRYFSQKSA